MLRNARIHTVYLTCKSVLCDYWHIKCHWYSSDERFKHNSTELSNLLALSNEHIGALKSNNSSSLHIIWWGNVKIHSLHDLVQQEPTYWGTEIHHSLIPETGAFYGSQRLRKAMRARRSAAKAETRHTFSRKRSARARGRWAAHAAQTKGIRRNANKRRIQKVIKTKGERVYVQLHKTHER